MRFHRRSLIAAAIAATLGTLLYYFDDIAGLGDGHAGTTLAATLEALEVALLIPGFALLVFTVSEYSALREAVLEERMRSMARERFVVLGRLAACTAHEIGNPVHNLFLLADELHEHLRLPDSDPADRMLHRIQANVVRLKQAVDSIYALARPSGDDEGQTRLDGDLVTAITDWQTENTRWSELHLHPAPALPASCRVAIPASALRIVASNLLRNAIQAVLAEGQGSVSVMVACGATHSTLELRNPGKLAEDFTNSDSEALPSAKPGGLGLGLFVSRQLVATHGGRITLQQDGPDVVCRLELPALGDEQSNESDTNG